MPVSTPAYATAATRTASSASALQTQLSAATSGDVIEYTGPALGSVTLTGGSTGWATNVLIRPPLGSRVTCTALALQAAHVTVAGFDFTTSSSITTGATRSALWRCTSATGTWGIYYVDNAALVECVGYQFRPDVTGDRCQFFSSAASPIAAPLMDGCYLAAQSLLAASGAHLDTLQIEGIGGTSVTDPAVRNSVLLAHASANSPLLAATAIGGTLTVDNNWVGVAEFNAGAFSSGSVHVTGTDFAGAPLFAASPSEFTGNRVAAAAVQLTGGATLPGGSNAVSAGLSLPPDPLGDLTVLWPECPSAVVLA